ncbi:MAG: pyrroline-5-carboxylate reductase [Oscillospiraceae bacterium]|jgi:pyrroline-5-carboxylate reductase|nr:pyrroline-5-carboxylate reductase [Oscillospiraceae bacterium]
MDKRRFGLIGVGVMGGAMLSAALQTGFLNARDVIVYDKTAAQRARAAAEFGVHIASSAGEVARYAEIVQLSVKPQDYPALLAAIDADLARERPLVLSIAAGLTLAKTAGMLPQSGADVSLVRMMQNINATVGESMTAYCPNGKVSPDAFAVVEKYCRCFGRVLRLEEQYFSAFLALAGSAPAFVYLFMDELARAGVACGLQKATALEIAVQTVLGSAKLLQSSEKHPQALIDQVCSPAGTTVAGMEALHEYGFTNAVHQAVKAAYARDKALGA